MYSNKSIISPDPKSRLTEHLSNYSLSTVYGIHRTDFLRMVYQELLNSAVDPMQFGELLPSILTLVYGKMKRLDVLYAARQKYSRVGYWPSLTEFMAAGRYDKEYAKFRDCLTAHLSKKSQLNIEESRRVVDKAMNNYLRYYFGSSMFTLRSKAGIKRIINKSTLLERFYLSYRHFRNRNKQTPKLNNLPPIEYDNPENEYYQDFIRIKKAIENSIVK